jgi:hypothetical protein
MKDIGKDDDEKSLLVGWGLQRRSLQPLGYLFEKPAEWLMRTVARREKCDTSDYQFAITPPPTTNKLDAARNALFSQAQRRAGCGVT